MSRRDAIKYCASHGSRLPNAIEVLKLLIKRGAKGLVRCDAFNNKSTNCYKREIAYADGTKTELSLSTDGYRPPQDLASNYMFSWTSSNGTESDRTEDIIGEPAIVFTERDGFLSYKSASDMGSARCVLDF